MKNADNNGPYIHVDYVASRIAFLYERVRQVIDFQEEHVMRENAIERILRRRLFFTERQEPFALDLIEELIRGGYFLNDSIPEERTVGVQEILDKYIAMLGGLRETKRDTGKLLGFLYGIAACEIEEFLDPPMREVVLLEFEYDTLRSRLRILGPEISDDKKDILLFVAINQTLLRADKRRMYFRLMQKLHPKWFAEHDPARREFSSTIEQIKASFDEIIEHAALKRIRNFTRQFAIVFHIISDITGNDPARLTALAADKAMLTQEVKKAYEKRFYLLKTKLRRTSFRSVVSIFLSKVLIAIAVEIPLELFIMERAVFYSFFISILFPPLLMLFIVASIRMPPQSNLDKLIVQVRSIINGTFTFEPIELRSKKRRLVVSLILGCVQLLMLGIVFSITIFTLNLAHLSFFSILIFLLFVSLIIFSGTRIKQWSYELTAGTRKEGVGGFMVDVLTLPIVSLGKILAAELGRFNIVILFLNLFFEAPLQSFIRFVEEWRRFIREKKEEL